MKNRLLIYAAMLASCLAGCSKASYWDENRASEAADREDWEYDAIVTVKRSPTDTIYFQLDDNTRLCPGNFQKPGWELQRIICHLTEYPYPISCYGNYAEVDWLEPLEKGEFTFSAATGDGDGVDIITDWMTSVEDGFLTLHYRTWWGSGDVQHRLSLHSGLNPEDPYELLLVHDARGDAALEEADALVYFDINSLPSTEGNYTTLTLKWTSGEGTRTARQFRFRSRE